MKLKRKNKIQTGVTPKKSKVIRFFIDKKKEARGLGLDNYRPRNYINGNSFGMFQDEAIRLGMVKEKNK